MRKRPRDPATTVSSSIAWKVALAFLGCGVIWIVATDLLLYTFVSNRVVIARIETAKGWAFVGLVTLILYIVTRHVVRALARSNETINAVVTSISDGVLLLGRDGSIKYANPAVQRMLGTDRGSLVGMSAEEFARRYHVARDNGRLLAPQELVSQRALAGESPPPYKARIHPPGRPEVFAIVTGAPVRPIPEGPVALAVSVIHDVTALEHLDEMRDEFISSAAHLLKTPISVISAHCQLLAAGRSASWRASTAAIERQCARINRLTENLLVLARLRSHSLQLDPARVDFAGIVDDAIREMRDASPDHTLRANVHAHPNVFADRNRLTLAIRNLIELAYRRSVPRTDITVEVDQVDSRGRVSVTYEPLVPLDVLDADAGLSGLPLEDYVAAEVVSASSGSRGSEEAIHRHRDWVEIPTVEGLTADERGLPKLIRS